MSTLLLLLVFPIFWPFVAKYIWGHEITIGEMAITVGVAALVVSVGFFGGRYSQTADSEVLNGQVTSKAPERVSCSHSYSCNCSERCSGSGKSRSCSTTCSTCYDHAWDQNWVLRTTLGDMNVARVDRRGLTEPPRYARAAAGDPVASTRGYENLIKGAPDSLFNALREQAALAQFQQKVPAYPLNVRDIHYLDRVLLASGATVPDLAQWNQDLALRLRTLGPAKQTNVVIVMAKEASSAFGSAVQATWLGGKKNDVIVVLGIPDYPKLSWARVFSWSDNELFKVQLRDDLQAMPTVDRVAVINAIEKHVAAGFKRKPMADFEYLRNEIHPPMWLTALLAFLGALASVLTSWFMAKNDIRTAAGESLRRAAHGIQRYRTQS